MSLQRPPGPAAAWPSSTVTGYHYPHHRPSCCCIKHTRSPSPAALVLPKLRLPAAIPPDLRLP
jgi:hypothetical protein